jgi:hypothetical protein
VELLADPSATPGELAAAIDRLEADRRYEAAWPITRLQYHESPLVRGRALLALTRTWRDSDINLMRDMLEDDAGWEARAAAATCVPYLLQWYPNLREVAREWLVEALVRERDGRVEEAIREAVERVDHSDDTSHDR